MTLFLPTIRQTAAVRPEIVRLDGTAWRICDGAMAERDPHRLLGYIEYLPDGRYEVLWLSAPIAWAYVDSFDLALDAIADRASFDGAVSAERDPTLRAPRAPLQRVPAERGA